MKCGADVSGEQGNIATTVLPAAGERDPMEEVLELVKKATIGEYEILTELGRGGMASVYLAHDIALDRKVAIKVMSPALLMMGEGMTERFRREARTAANLSHPHIIPIYTVKSTGKTLFFVMKFVPGRSLEAIIKDTGPMPVPMVKAILQQVAGALGYAHRSGIVHRDVKPANIMIDDEGWSVVTDFGIAKVAENRGLTMTGVAVGTPAYMSPEQCAAKDITGKSDQYSLGVVAYEMLTGRQPFQGDSAMAIMFAHFHEQPRPLIEERPDCPADLATLVMRMLEKGPDRRWESMEELVTGLNARPLAHDDPIRIQLLELARKGGGRSLLDTIPSPPSSPVPPARGRAASEAATTPMPVHRVVDLALAPARGEVYVGDAMQFTATPRSASGVTAASPVNWATNNQAVASINSSGLLTGHAAGVATVIATCDGVSATAEVTVAVVPVGSVAIEPAELRLGEGEEHDLVATVKDRRGALAAGREVRWSVTPAGAATVTERGHLVALKEGAVEVVAECDGVRGRARVAVVPAAVASITIHPSNPEVVAGQSLTLKVELTDARGRPLDRRPVTWRSASERIATVGPNGLLAGLSEGTTEIVASAEGREATVRVRVTPAAVASVTVAPPPPVTVGSTLQLVALLKDARGNPLTGREVKWQSAAAKVASVNAAGEVTGVAPGSAKITASCEAHSWTVTVGVVPVPVASVRIEGAAPLTVGATAMLRALVADEAGHLLSGRPVSWISDSPKLLAVSSDGKVIAKAAGTVTIRARAEGKEAEVSITVAPAQVSEAVTAKIAAEGLPMAAVPVPVESMPVEREASPAPSGGKGRLIGVLLGVAAVAVVGVMLMKRGGAEAPATPVETATPAAAPVTSPEPQPVAIARVTIVGETGPVAVGRTRQYAVQLHDSAGNELGGRAVAWTSSDSSVLTVSLVGAVTGRKPGSATVTASSEGRSGSITVPVHEATADLPAPVASVNLAGGGKTLDPGGTAQLSAETRDAKGRPLAGRTVVWNSSDQAVAGVSSAGLVTAVGPGTATITASSEGLDARTTITVNQPRPAPVATLALTPSTASVDVGATTRLEAAARDDRGQALTDRPVAWKSSDERIARVDREGAVTGVAKGSVTITATAEGKSSSATVTVNEVLVTAASVAITAPERELTVGKTTRWSALAKDARGKDLADRTVTWTSSAPQVAKVDGGLVTAVGAGTAEIRATVDGRSATQTVTVKAAVAAAPPPQPVPAPAASPAGAGILPKKALQAGGGLTCGLGDRGVVCWGGGSGTPSVISGTADLRSIGVGRGFACGLRSGGEAVCWGENKSGQLGDGSTATSPTPVAVQGDRTFSAIAVGGAHACGLADGKIWCWGRGKNGQLGEGQTSDRKKPVQVRSKESFTAVAAGDDHTCALNATGKAFCWGLGFAGQLGFGSHDQMTEPVDVSGKPRYQSIVAGAKHTCALTQEGKAYCWGANESGQIGDGSKDDRTTPTAVSSDEAFASLTTGNAHTCGVTAAGSVFCWGENKAGQLGNGSNKNSAKPVQVPVSGRFRAVSAGGGHTCGLTADGEVLCWGNNAQGQLGDGGTEDRASPGPVRAN
jgi:serine/threonine protein kinase